MIIFATSFHQEKYTWNSKAILPQRYVLIQCLVSWPISVVTKLSQRRVSAEANPVSSCELLSTTSRCQLSTSSVQLCVVPPGTLLWQRNALILTSHLSWHITIGSRSQWFKIKTGLNFLWDGLETFIGKVKDEILACCSLLFDPKFCMVCCMLQSHPKPLVLFQLFRRFHTKQAMTAWTQKHANTDLRQRLTNIFKTLQCPRLWNIHFMKRVCIQEEPIQCSFDSGWNQCNCWQEQDLLSI